MPIHKLFSQRRHPSKKGVDVYQYDVLPDTFRRQVVHILVSTLGKYEDPRFSTASFSSANVRWEALFSRYIRELGVFRLGNDRNANLYEQCLQYLQTASTEEALDFIDCAFQFIHQDLGHNLVYTGGARGGYPPHIIDGIIEELNQRFQQHRIGYQFQNGQLNKQTDHYLHEEVILPALTILAHPQFRGAQDEFLSAHRHYREKHYKEAVADALRAFESTMKSILDERKWQYDKEKDTAQKLIKILFEQHIIPPMLESQFTSLRSLLESGLPTVRNRTSGHGQGSTPIPIPKYIAEYALHVAAANIVFLVQAYEEHKQARTK